MNNQRSSWGNVFQTFLLLFIALVLFVQLAISGYSFYRHETIRKQLTDYTTKVDALSASLMADYNKNVYHNSSVDSAVKQQVIGNDYIVGFLQLIVEQNNQLIQALADLH